MSLLAFNSSCRIFRAPWVVPVVAPVIADGAVLVDGDTILDVGSFADISQRHPHVIVSQCTGVLLPALVNAHIHLELSAYGPVAPKSPESSMCDWISSLLCIREEAGFSRAEILEAAIVAAQDQKASGVALLLDIGNTRLEGLNSSGIEIISLLEMLGPSKDAESAAIKNIDDLPDSTAITGHAPYSTTPALLRYIKKRSQRLHTLFSIHLAENSDEYLLLTRAQGCFATFLKDRNGFDGSFPISGINASCILSYLKDFELLDEHSICVHCVHLSEKDIMIIAESQAHICVCPGSNRFLSVGIAPLERFLEQGILPAIGTDSITSNPVPDIWEEMTLLRANHLSVSDELILKMATLGGARALQRADRYGTLAKGRSAKIIHVRSPHYEKLQNGSQLLERLISCGRPESVEWLSVPKD